MKNANVHKRRKASALRQKLNRFFKKDDGAVAVEFALTFPIFMTAIILIIELARVVYVQAVVTFAAEEATRYALVNYAATTQELEEYATSNLLGVSQDQLVSIVVSGDLNADNTRLISITITYQYTPIIPVNMLLGDASRNGFQISGTSAGFLTEENAVT